MGERQNSKGLTVRNAHKLLRFLAQNKETLSPLLILTHDYPDPDALAAASGLQYLAEKFFQIQSRIVYGGIIGRMENRAMVSLLKLPVHKLHRTDFRKYEKVAIVDTQPGFRNNSFPEGKRATIVIDQHPYETKPAADLAIIDAESGATSVIIARALLLQKLEIPSSIATALAYGILTDTLNLYRAAHRDVIQTYLDLLTHCDLKALARIQNPDRSRRFFASLSKGIHKAKVGRNFLISNLGFVESPDLVAQVADFLLTYKTVCWSACTGRYNGRLYVSLRTSVTNLEAGEVLRDAFLNREEAGGHDKIAGGSFKVGKNVSREVWRDAEMAFAERLKKRLRIPQKSKFYFPFRQTGQGK